MRRGPFALLNLSNYPIWLKISLLVGIGLLAFGIPAVVTVRAATLESGFESARQYLQINSSQRVTNIRSLVDAARDALNATSSDPVVRQTLIRYLSDDPIPGVAPLTSEDLGRLLQEQLLTPSSTAFSDVRFINADGLVIAARGVNSEGDQSLLGNNQVNSPAYRAGLAALANGLNSALVVSDSGGSTFIEIASVVQRRSGELIGFLVGRMNSVVIQSALSALNLDYPMSNYLVGESAMIAPVVQPADSVTPSMSAGAQRALAGQTGMETYTLTTGERVLGYYSPVSGSALGFVSEVTLAAVNARSVSFFTARAFSLLVAFIALGALLVGLLVTLNQQITPPLKRLRRVTQALGSGDFAPPVPDAARGDEIGELASSFVMMRDQVHTLVSELQTRLEARARDIDTTQEISRFTATQGDLQSLLDRIITLLTERFSNIYHAQIFLVDVEGRSALLQASTGQAGRELLDSGHRVPIGSISLVGQAIEHRRIMIGRDVTPNDPARTHDTLPETRTEVALPLLFRDRVIGVLDVQSKQRNSFSEEQINVLQTVSNQIAVGIQTVQLYEQSVRRLEQIEQANRRATLRVWQDYMRAQRQQEMSSSAGREPSHDMSELRQSALSTGRPTLGEVTDRGTLPIAIPITISGQTIGAVEWEISAHDYDENVLDLAQELARRLAVSLENARLFQESRRAAERERLVNNIAARLTAQTNVHEILQTAVREVGQALRAPQVSIRLRGSGAEAVTETNGHGGSHANGNGANGHHSA